MLGDKIDIFDESLEPLQAFIQPGGSKKAAFLDQARTVCRRTERLAVEFQMKENIGNSIVKYLNRLSDYFFTASRYANHFERIPDIKWE